VRVLDQRLEALWDKVRQGERLTREDGLLLFATNDLLGVGRMAGHVKSRREDDRSTSVMNRYITLTNLCVLSCAFCDSPGSRASGRFEHD
jgi:aminodeoxyfutalosine synthase